MLTDVSPQCAEGAYSQPIRSDMPASLSSLSGQWTMSPASSDVTPTLEIQGVAFYIRKIASSAPVSLDIDQSKGKDGPIFIKQSTIANIPAVNEEWYLDGKERNQEDRILGKVASKSRWAKIGDLRAEHVEDYLLENLGDDGDTIYAEVWSTEGTEWTARQVWLVEGDNFVRRVVTRGVSSGKCAEAKLVYERK